MAKKKSPKPVDPEFQPVAEAEDVPPIDEGEEVPIDDVPVEDAPEPVTPPTLKVEGPVAQNDGTYVWYGEGPPRDVNVGGARYEHTHENAAGQWVYTKS